MLSIPHGWTGWLVAAGVFFVLLCAAAIVSPVAVATQFRKDGSNDDASVTIRALYGLIRYHIQIPIIQFKGLSILLKKETSSKSVGMSFSNEAENEIDAHKVKRAMDKLKAIVQLTYDLKGITRESLLRVKLTEWRWTTTVGTDDAMWTALATGSVWSAITTITGLLSQMMQLKTVPQLDVNPSYKEACFKTEFSCKSEIRLGYALLAAIQLIVRMKKNKRSFRLWRSILFKPRPG